MGLQEGDYTAPSDLRRHIVEAAVKEVNEKTDIQVEYHVIKNGNRGAITGFSFRFVQVEEIEIIPESRHLEFLSEQCAKLPEGLEAQRGIIALLKKYIEENGYEYVQSNVDYMVERLADKKQAPIPNPGGYLRRVLENDYGAEIRERIEIQKLMAERRRQAAEAAAAMSGAATAGGEEAEAQIAELVEKY